MTDPPHAARQQAYYSRGTTARATPLGQFSDGIANQHSYRCGKTENINQEINYLLSTNETKPTLQINRLSENEPLLRPSIRGKLWRILPFSGKRPQNLAEDRRFSQPILLKRVKSRGESQAVTGVGSDSVGRSCSGGCPHRRASSPKQNGNGDIAATTN